MCLSIVATIELKPRGKILFCFFCHPDPKASSKKKKKKASLQFLCCVKTFLGYSVPFHEKRSESVLWVFASIPVVTLIRWNCTVRWLLSKKRPTAWYFQKTQILGEKAVCCNEGRNDLMAFLAGVITIPSFYSGKILFLPSGPNFQVHTNRFLCMFRALRKDTLDTLYNFIKKKKEVREKYCVSFNCHTSCYPD